MVDFNEARTVPTLPGRLSFHRLTAVEAFEEAKKGPFPVADVSAAAPYANLLLTQGHYERLLKQVYDVYFPAAIELYKQDEKAKGSLSQAQVDQLKQELETLSGLLVTPFKAPSEKTLDLFPDCAASVKVLGTKGTDMDVKAIITKQDEVADEEVDLIVTGRTIVPIEKTKKKLYSGCWVVAKGLRFFAYNTGGPKKPGFSLGGNELVFARDDASFSGGIVVSDDDIFAALDE